MSNEHLLFGIWKRGGAAGKGLTAEARRAQRNEKWKMLNAQCSMSLGVLLFLNGCVVVPSAVIRREITGCQCQVGEGKERVVRDLWRDGGAARQEEPGK